MNSVIHVHELSDYLGQYPNASDDLVETTLLVPSGAIGCHSIDVSEVPKRFLKQALPAMLEDLVMDDIENHHLSQGSYNKKQPLPVLLANKQQMQQWLDSAKSCGLKVRASYPDFYALPWQEGQITVLAADDYMVVRDDIHSGFSGTIDECCAILTLKLSQMAIAPKLVLHGQRDCLAQFPQEIEFKGDLGDKTVDAVAINLCQGDFGVKVERSNPYKGLAWPAATAACLVLAMCLNNLSQAHYFNKQSALLAPQIEQDYQRLFSAPASGSWLGLAKIQAQLANIQLNSSELKHWQLLKRINTKINSCKDCQIDEITINNDSALITLKKDGSDSLLLSLKNDQSLSMEETDNNPIAAAISIKVSLADRV